MSKLMQKCCHMEPVTYLAVFKPHLGEQTMYITAYIDYIFVNDQLLAVMINHRKVLVNALHWCVKCCAINMLKITYTTSRTKCAHL